MNCINCGGEIPEDYLYCPNCGTPVQMVPDYSSLEGLLADEVNEVINSIQREKKDETEYLYRTGYVRRTGNITGRNPREQELRRSQSQKERQEQEYRRAQLQREKQEQERKAKARKKRITTGIIAGIIVVAVIMVAVVFLTGNTYTARMSKADRQFAAGNYKEALSNYYEASTLNENSADAYVGMGNCYIKLEDSEQALAAYKNAVMVDKSDPDAYLALAKYYESIDDNDSITALFANVTDKKVISACSDYIAEVPVISPEPGEYTDSVKVVMSSGSGTIRFTMDGSLPNGESPQYTEPVILNENADYSIRAITINSKGIASDDACAEFKVNIPSPDGPVVKPAAGTYNSYTQITVEIPADSVVYYTLDGTEPTENSTQYTGPVDMPQGRSTFACIAVNSQGKASSVIKRQYNLIILN